jgi:hypothetical protein
MRRGDGGQGKRYQVDRSRGDQGNLQEVLEHIARRQGICAS